VVELHDCFTANELISYEALRLTPEGTAEKFIADGDNTYGGQVVTNPSGGLLSKGHPLGATGLAQCNELVRKPRGQADARQVDGRSAAQHRSWRCRGGHPVREGELTCRCSRRSSALTWPRSRCTSTRVPRRDQLAVTTLARDDLLPTDRETP
jgi:hypothetical protein